MLRQAKRSPCKNPKRMCIGVTGGVYESGGGRGCCASGWPLNPTSDRINPKPYGFARLVPVVSAETLLQTELQTELPTSAEAPSSFGEFRSSVFSSLGIDRSFGILIHEDPEWVAFRFGSIDKYHKERSLKDQQGRTSQSPAWALITISTTTSVSSITNLSVTTFPVTIVVIIILIIITIIITVHLKPFDTRVSLESSNMKSRTLTIYARDTTGRVIFKSGALVVCELGLCQTIVCV